MNIIKINHLEKDIIKKIYVFKGLLDVSNDYITNDNQKIFSDNELQNISENNIPVELIS